MPSTTRRASTASSASCGPELLVTPDATAEERALAERGRFFVERERGYAQLQRTKPQTLGYGLADSPVAQAAWIVETLRTWTDDPRLLDHSELRDRVLDNVSVYWSTNTGASSARIYLGSSLSASPPPS